MRKKAFEKLLRAAVIADAEAQGSLLEKETEPIPEEARARFVAALNEADREKQTETQREFAAPLARFRKPAVRWAVSLSFAAAVLVVALLIGTKSLRAAHEHELLPRDAETTLAPQSTNAPMSLPEPGAEASPSASDAVPPFGGDSEGPAFILNGEKLDVYTAQYSIKKQEDRIPLNAFLQSIGAETADSSYNRYQVQCYQIQGIRYIYDWESQVLALEEQYDGVVQTLKEQGSKPTKSDFQTINLLSGEEDMQAEVWLDSRTLESVLRKMGLDITIEIDREANTIRVELSETEEKP